MSHTHTGALAEGGKSRYVAQRAALASRALAPQARCEQRTTMTKTSDPYVTFFSLWFKAQTIPHAREGNVEALHYMAICFLSFLSHGGSLPTPKP